MRSLFATAMCALLVGCNGFAELPHQHEAEVVIFRLTYGDLKDSRPNIEWIEQDDLNCQPDSDGRNTGFMIGSFYGDVKKDSLCVWGVSWIDNGLAQVAHRSDRFSGMSLAHEELHFFLADAGRDDADHQDPAFGLAYGHPYGLLDQANDNLREQGW